MSYALRMEKEYSDFEQRRALQQFHDAVNNHIIEKVADELLIDKMDDSPSLTLISHLSGIFDNSTGGFQDDLEYFMGQAIRRRDSEMAGFLAEEMYDPYSQYRYNERFREKVQEIMDGKEKAGLRLI